MGTFVRPAPPTSSASDTDTTLPLRHSQYFEVLPYTMKSTNVMLCVSSLLFAIAFGDCMDDLFTGIAKLKVDAPSFTGDARDLHQRIADVRDAIPASPSVDLRKAMSLLR